MQRTQRGPPPTACQGSGPAARPPASRAIARLARIPRTGGPRKGAALRGQGRPRIHPGCPRVPSGLAPLAAAQPLAQEWWQGQRQVGAVHRGQWPRGVWPRAGQALSGMASGTPRSTGGALPPALPARGVWRTKGAPAPAAHRGPPRAQEGRGPQGEHQGVPLPLSLPLPLVRGRGGTSSGRTRCCGLRLRWPFWNPKGALRVTPGKPRLSRSIGGRRRGVLVQSAAQVEVALSVSVLLAAATQPGGRPVRVTRAAALGG